jgi:hypothetical protein
MRCVTDVPEHMQHGAGDTAQKITLTGAIEDSVLRVFRSIHRERSPFPAASG